MGSTRFHADAGQTRPVDLVLDPAKVPHYELAFSSFVKREYNFDLRPDRAICRLYQQGHCPMGEACPDRHPHTSNYSNLICKHWLRGLCKKGAACEFLHEYNLRLMPECTQFAHYGTCTNGSDCLYLHVPPESKGAPCAHYERGFCPLGPHCAARHVASASFCPRYMAGFCPDGRDCKDGAHPKWVGKEDLPRPQVKVIKTKDQIEADNKAALDRMERDREDDEREREEKGLGPRREGFGGRGRGRARGRGEWRGRGGGGGGGARGAGGDRY